jgi:hypothetical protein
VPGGVPLLLFGSLEHAIRIERTARPPVVIGIDNDRSVQKAGWRISGVPT